MFLKLVIVTAFSLVGAYGAPASYLDTRYDNVELTKMLNNDELYVILLQCVTKQGECTSDQKSLRDAVPKAMLDECAGCSQSLTTGTQILLEHLILEKPDDMLLLDGLYDPDGSYRKRFEKETNVINRKRSAPLTEVDIFTPSKRDIK